MLKHQVPPDLTAVIHLIVSIFFANLFLSLAEITLREYPLEVFFLKLCFVNAPSSDGRVHIVVIRRGLVCADKTQFFIHSAAEHTGIGVAG